MILKDMILKENKFYIELGKYVKYYKSCINVINVAIPMLERYERFIDRSFNSIENNVYYIKYIQMFSHIQAILKNFRRKSLSIMQDLNININKFEEKIDEYRNLCCLMGKPKFDRAHDTMVYMYYLTMTKVQSALHMLDEEGEFIAIHFIYIPIAPMHFRKIVDLHDTPILRDQFDSVRIVLDSSYTSRLKGGNRVYGIEVSGVMRDGKDADFNYDVRFLISSNNTIATENAKVIKVNNADLLVRVETDTLINHIYYIYMDVDSKYDPPIPSSFTRNTQKDTYVHIGDISYVIYREKNLFMFPDDVKENQTLR